jgi:hypothetical protein
MTINVPAINGATMAATTGRMLAIVQAGYSSADVLRLDPIRRGLIAGSALGAFQPHHSTPTTSI